jgi:glutaredoxin
MTNILLISLKNCPYSEAAKQLLDNYKIKYKYILVNNIDSEKIKYKNKNINTFPQIYYFKKNKKKLIGGYDDLKFIIDIINDSKDINKILKKYNKWAKKDILRIIALFAL